MILAPVIIAIATATPSPAAELKWNAPCALDIPVCNRHLQRREFRRMLKLSPIA